MRVTVRDACGAVEETAESKGGTEKLKEGITESRGEEKRIETEKGIANGAEENETDIQRRVEIAAGQIKSVKEEVPR